MEKRDLDKLRKEHKERFGKTKESSRRNSNEMSGSVPPSKRNEEAKPTNEAISENPATPISELNSKDVKKPRLKQNLGSSRSVHQSKAKEARTQRLKPTSRFSSKLIAVAVLTLVIGLFILIGKGLNSHKDDQAMGAESKYSSPNAKALDWERIDFVKYKIENDGTRNLHVSDFVRQYGLAQTSNEMKVGKKDKLLSLTYNLKGGGVAVIQFWNRGSGPHLVSVSYDTTQKEYLTDERLAFLRGISPDEEKGITDIEIVDQVGVPKRYYKSNIEGYSILNMAYQTKDKTFVLLEFARDKDRKFHLKKVQESKNDFDV
ncbi:hypothetical protein MK514_09825 [Streptococcus gordonii]|uniref:hypothetical protein n=1 Tax=Streptococcus gordonii TaxID=1302 RepID=UPI0022843A7D|nr:hypothetical protein [Streptococcus gordonii]MCY7130013.1 hypothetical protein [Streptococcus gordonii]MCY7141926.1 hypothetical protein [Streptococcus gordonii]